MSTLLGVLFLTGCGDNPQEEPQDTEIPEETIEEPATDNDGETQENIEEPTEDTDEGHETSEEDMAPASDEELEEGESVSDFTNYSELEMQDFFNPEEFDASLVTNNPGTRVFIFRDGDQQAYKTVFIKNNNRLKVIDIINDELLMNEQIN